VFARAAHLNELLPAFELRRAVLAYVGTILLIDVCAAARWTLAASVLAAVVILILTNHELATARVTDSEGAVSLSVFAALALLPQLRLLSVMAALGNVSDVARSAYVGGPMLVAGATLIGWRRLVGDFRTAGRHDVWIAGVGAALSIPAYFLARPDQIGGSEGLLRGIVATFALVVCSGLMEEVVFRGAVQRALQAVFPRGAVGLSALLFAAAFVNQAPISYVALIAAFGLFAAIVFGRTGSVAGIAIAHGLLIAGALFVWPVVFG